jgi:hypothetical protein
MSLLRWLGASFAVAIAAASFAACKSSGASTGGAGGTGTGGAGTGGALVTTSSSSSGSMPEAGLECKGTYGSVPKGECDLWLQDCPPGQTCKPAQSGSDYTTQCVAGGGLKTGGEECFAPNECAEKLFCVSGKCSPVCCRDNAAGCNGAICNISAQVGQYELFFCHYAPKCTLLTENACPEGLDCHIEDAIQGLATCGEPSGTPAGDMGGCQFINDCPNMEQCYNGTCHFYCWANAAPGTAAGLGGCPEHQVCKTSAGGKKIDYGVSGLGLCFSDGTIEPDAGSDAGSDAGNTGGGGSGTGGGNTSGSGTGGGNTGGAGPKDAASD